VLDIQPKIIPEKKKDDANDYKNIKQDKEERFKLQSCTELRRQTGLQGQ
jgi:hypothetical protein